ncbi:hypothetical protein DL764_004317 [Monosporascus ibericus]|uniref:DUF8035 domain-containing protein n=1 Tax=Monosporascus ibericus TaxID=155417 RepID=A0A4Q4TD71_9PEZI|nr:hypothetical protein DL764_004317 [Monosporascus ibericus]
MARKSSADDDLAYGERWDKDRFLFERDRERERDRIEERDRYISRGPPARAREVSPDRPERRPAATRPPYPWEDDHPRPRERRYGDDDRRARRSPPIELERDLDRRLVIDRERERNYRDSSPPRPPRPGMMLRRQSSLDIFDRRPMPRFYDRDEPGPPALRGDYRPDPYEPIPLPRSRALPPPRTYAERDYDEIKVSDPDRYGNEEYHTYPDRLREREYVRMKRRRSDSRTSRARTHRTSSRRSSSRTSTTSSSSSSSSSGGTTVTAKSEYPKKGKTRIPARLVSTRALIDLGYPFIQEKALGQENIDDVLKLSEDYKKAELEVLAARSSHAAEDRREDVFTIPPQAPAVPVITTAPPPPAPAGYAAAPAPGGYAVAAAPAPAPAVPVAEYVTRDLSPSRSSRTTRHRRSRSTSTATTSTSTSTSYRDPVLVDAYPWEVGSHAPAAGPVMLVDDRYRTDRDIKMEIAQLEAERDLMKRERRRHRSRHHRSRSRSTAGGELVRAERLPTGELVLYEEEVERIEEPRRGVRIEKDKKGPPPGLMKAMLATLT